MNQEELLQNTLNVTIDRMGNNARSYEAEIANLNAQILLLNNQIEILTNSSVKDSPK